MADVMFGADFGGMDDFGQLITRRTCARQTELWLALKDEYERTGTVTLMEE